MKHIVAISGASGAIFGIELLKSLPSSDTKVLVMSQTAKLIIEDETDYTVTQVEQMADEVYENFDLAAQVSSGSNPFDNLVISPCSASTFSKIAAGISDNLITRVASVALKEKRRLIILPREAPLSTVHLENLTKISNWGAIIFPPAPPFYHYPKTLQDQLDFVTGRTLELMGIENKKYKKWGQE
jgi:flavin prenyltransferase